VPESWQSKAQPTDFYFLKGVVENILRRCGISNFGTEKIRNSIFEEGLSYTVGKNYIGRIGRVNHEIASDFEIKKEIWYAEFDTKAVVKFSKHTTSFKEPSKFPAVRRDLAMILNDDISFSKIESLAFKQVRGLLKEVNLFDVYKDDKLGTQKKSYAVSFLLQDEKKTLTDQEVDNVMEQLIRTFEKELGAAIRSN
jgi:phenylalanyl-tRNA synthetase beta chain